jgi:hypothetical protein
MKKTLLLPIFILSFFSVFAQQDVLLEKYMKQSIKQEFAIDSLKKVSKSENDNFSKQSKDYQSKLNAKNDTIKILKLNLSKLEKYKSEMNKNEALFKQKNDSIILLKNQIGILNKQKLDENQKYIQNLREENIKGKNEVKSKFIDYYKNKKFDELIVSTSKNSIQRDLLIIEDNNDKALLNDLIIFFEAKAVLEKKYNNEQLKITLFQLNQLKRQSEMLTSLAENIDNYQIFNNGLVECLLKINKIDNKETVGNDKDLKILKYNKILSEISIYIFEYGFNFVDYPYLSDILSQLIKRKKPNPDADINDLIKKLQ